MSYGCLHPRIATKVLALPCVSCLPVLSAPACPVCPCLPLSPPPILGSIDSRAAGTMRVAGRASQLPESLTYPNWLVELKKCVVAWSETLPPFTA
jgi:hypothetical protein